MRGFVRDVLSVARSKGVVIASALLKGVILARWLGPEQVGVLAALMVYPSLLMSVGSLGLQQVTAYLLGGGHYGERELKRAIAQTWFLSSSVSLGASYLLLRYVGSSGESLLLVLLAIAPIPFSLFNRYNGGLFLGRNNIGDYNRINWIPSVVTFAATAILVIGLEAGLSGALIAAIAGPFCMSVILTIRHDFLRSFSFNFDWKLIRRMLALGSVYAISLMVINLNYRVDVILLDRLSSDFEVGIYSRAVLPIEYLWEIPMLLSTIIFARSATAKDGAKFSRNVHQLLRLSFVAIGLASVLLAALADQVVGLLFGEAFLASGPVLVALVPGVVLLTIFKVLNMDLAGKGKPWVAMKAMVPALVINVGMNLLVIPVYGAWGAAISTTVSYSLAAILFLFFYSRAIDVPVREIVRFRRDDFDSLRKVFQATGSLAAR